MYCSPINVADNDSKLFESIKNAANGDVVIMGDLNFPDIKWDGGFSGSRVVISLR